MEKKHDSLLNNTDKTKELKKTPEEIEKEKFLSLLKEIVSISREIDKTRNSETGNLSCTYQVKNEDGFNEIILEDLDGEGLAIEKTNSKTGEILVYSLYTGSNYNREIPDIGDEGLILSYGKLKIGDEHHPFANYDENSPLEKVQITTSEELQKVINNFKKRLEEYKQYTKQEKKQKMEKLEKADSFANNPDEILDNIS